MKLGIFFKRISTGAHYAEGFTVRLFFVMINDIFQLYIQSIAFNSLFYQLHCHNMYFCVYFLLWIYRYHWLYVVLISDDADFLNTKVSFMDRWGDDLGLNNFNFFGRLLALHYIPTDFPPFLMYFLIWKVKISFQFFWERAQLRLPILPVVSRQSIHCFVLQSYVKLLG